MVEFSTVCGFFSSFHFPQIEQKDHKALVGIVLILCEQGNKSYLPVVLLLEFSNLHVVMIQKKQLQRGVLKLQIHCYCMQPAHLDKTFSYCSNFTRQSLNH